MRIRSFFGSQFGSMLLGRNLSVAALVALGVALAPNAASAQPPPKGQPGGPPEVMEPPSENPVPPSPSGEDANQPLSERLKQGDGVLEPPRSVDPGIKKPVPDEFESKTPVIKPPVDGKDADAPSTQPPSKAE